MALEEIRSIDKIEILENGTIQVREATSITKDGVEIAKNYHRWTLFPGQDVSDQDDRIKAIAKAAWTKDVVKAYKAQQEAALGA